MLVKKLSEKYTKKNRTLFVIVEIELAVLLIIMVYFLRSSLVSRNIDVYADKTDIPTVSAEEGYLKFNSIRVSVPKEGASYVIGYDWAKGDKEYPSIPSSASVSYNGDNDQVLYEVLLYRDSIIPKNEGDRQYTVDDWFEEWKRRSGSSTAQEVYETLNTKGFLIETTEDSSKDKKAYCSYAYYFAVKADESIEQYVLELVYYDHDSLDNAEDLIKSFADSIYIMKKVS